MELPNFTAAQRVQLRSGLLNFAASDARISGVAITGSAAADREDDWSDIDLAFGVAEASTLPVVLEDFTAHMYGSHQAIHHVDVRAGAWIYRVFILANTLQVDLAFVAEAEFRALAPTFRLVSGKANEPIHFPPPPAEGLIGMAWLHALHARSSIARGKFWEAEYMISGVRDHALTLACLRHGLPAAYGRGFDDLPEELTREWKAALVRELNAGELRRAFRVALEALTHEIEIADPILAGRLEPTLRKL